MTTQTQHQTSSTDLGQLQKHLCEVFCQDVALSEMEGHIVVPLPMTARDGDGITVFLDRSAGGGWRVSDMGITVMRLSYEHDISSIFRGTRGKLFQSIVAETGATERDGEIFLEVPADKLLQGIFSIGQAASRVGDLSLWTRSRTESTFFEDLRERVYSSVPAEKVKADHVVSGVPESEIYPVDYMIDTGGRPLYIFGVNSQDRARMATITIQHLRAHGPKFDAMTALSRLSDVPPQDLKRLMFAANDTIPSIDDGAAFAAKISHYVAAN